MGCCGCNSESQSVNQNEKEKEKNANIEIKIEQKKEPNIEPKKEPKIEPKKEPKKEIPELASKVKKIEIIKNCQIKASPVIPEDISKILKKSTARIEFNEKKKSSTGFFMKINIKGENFNFILTCNHSITQEEIDSKLQITIYFGKKENEEKIVIILDDKKRLIKTYEDLDITLIQILKKDNIKEKRFLFPDLNYQNFGFSFYKDSQVFTAGYPNVEFYKDGRHISSGLITKINLYNFEHNCDTRKGSSGSPIINLFKNVIGIHYGGDKNNKTNFGTFIGVIIDKLNSERENIIINKEIEEPKEANKVASLLKNGLKNVDNEIKDILPMIWPFLNSPEYMHHVRKMMGDSKIINILNQISIEIPEISNYINDMKDLFDEDNAEEFNDLIKSLENLNYENDNKSNEEDKKE